MTNRTLFLAAASTLIAAAALPASAAMPAKGDGGVKLSATLSGAAEVPRAGDPDGTGSFMARVNPGQGRVCYTLTVANIAAATMAHIHRGAVGVAGPVVVPLTPPTSGSSEACATITRELAMALIQHPEQYYANVHNAAFPGGAVRGQLTK